MVILMKRAKLLSVHPITSMTSLNVLIFVNYVKTTVINVMIMVRLKLHTVIIVIKQYQTVKFSCVPTRIALINVLIAQHLMIIQECVVSAWLMLAINK
jgi:hypothetical protein